MKTMFGIELNDIQYAELELLNKCVDRGNSLREFSSKRIQANQAIGDVYRELSHKKLVHAFNTQYGAICTELTSNGARYIPELAEQEASAVKAIKANRKHDYGLAVFSMTGSAILGIVVAFITSVITTIVYNAFFAG
jgi:hypothetical protein